MKRFLIALALVLPLGCDDGEGQADGGVDLLRVLNEGELCENGIGLTLGVCRAGLQCCTVNCTVRSDGGCLDLPSECVIQPPSTSSFCY